MIVKELLEWWDSEIFSQSKPEQDTLADEMTDWFELMKKQAAAKHVGLTNVTNQPPKDGQMQLGSNSGPEKDGQAGLQDGTGSVADKESLLS
ncbi:hypothetical protein M422DRAFT_265997 [Sphaerobolus stellatus SS14]|uniref:Uncharacterized protein n=1 Tax=Sphaerobolus stellatus (strain SS14) TaxID=990650 RepID=A0A0C9V435_SPHS4|nr:hypothetical protein M422DRAFT_265997 [Sphaerobolus stellatus SS14]